MSTAANAPTLVQYLVFAVAREEFALPILRVVEIVAYADPSRVPNAPPFLHGVVGLRGAIVPVIDLARVFGYERTAISRRSCIVLCQIAAGEQVTTVGLLAEVVREVADLDVDAIAPPPAVGAPVKAAFLIGLYAARGRFVFVLDIDRVLSEAELAAVGEAAAVQSPASRLVAVERAS